MFDNCKFCRNWVSWGHFCNSFPLWGLLNGEQCIDNDDEEEEEDRHEVTTPFYDEINLRRW